MRQPTRLRLAATIAPLLAFLLLGCQAVDEYLIVGKAKDRLTTVFECMTAEKRDENRAISMWAAGKRQLVGSTLEIAYDHYQTWLTKAGFQEVESFEILTAELEPDRIDDAVLFSVKVNGKDRRLRVAPKNEIEWLN